MGVASPKPMVDAVVSQWQCELGADDYPPRRNNPGNVAKGWADGVGIPYTVETPNPQPGNPIVTFGSPTDGARAYGRGIALFDRYAATLAHARVGDGAGFLQAITAAGYGTSYSCAIGVYRGLVGTPTAAPHYYAQVTIATALWNSGTKKWVYNGPNAIRVGTRLVVRGAKYLRGGVPCYPIVAGTKYGGYWVPVAHVKLTGRAP